jgi:hypothetical protein
MNPFLAHFQVSVDLEKKYAVRGQVILSEYIKTFLMSYSCEQTKFREEKTFSLDLR